MNRFTHSAKIAMLAFFPFSAIAENPPPCNQSRTPEDQVTTDAQPPGCIKTVNWRDGGCASPGGTKPSNFQRCLDQIQPKDNSSTPMTLVIVNDFDKDGKFIKTHQECDTAHPGQTSLTGVTVKCAVLDACPEKP